MSRLLAAGILTKVRQHCFNRILGSTFRCIF